MNTDYKYRPKTLDEFIFATTTLKNVIDSYADGENMRPLILHGPHGTGKSLLSELIPKSIDGPEVSVQRLTVDDLKTRKSIHDNLTRSLQFDSLFPTGDQSLYYTVFDECKFDSKVFNDAVRIAMDRMQGRCLYIFVTNELSKIDSGVVSRSTSVHVPPLNPEDFLPKALKILQSEGIDAPADVILDALVATHKVCKDHRRYYETLDRIIYRANRL